MKLYLTSVGFENDIVANYFATMFLPKEPKDLSFLVVSVQDNESDAFYLQKTKDELNKIGATNITIFELKEDNLIPNKNYDVIYVCGGNTFVYLDRIRKTGLDKFIIDSVRSNRSVYVGVSAGSIIAGPDITIAGDEDPNDIGLTEFKGLCLTNIIIYPHYTKDQTKELDKFKKATSHQIIELEDSQAVYLNYSNIGLLNGVLSMLYINKDL
jgi:peptidase E